MDGTKHSIFVVDDDPASVQLVQKLLEDAGHDVVTSTDSSTAMEAIIKLKPDCIIADLMMPKVDGLQLCQHVQRAAELDGVKFIMISAKAYDFDHKRSLDFGADGYIRKPLNSETFATRVNRVLNDHIDMTFWGVRGTLPVSGEGSLKYGGNTSCVSLEFPKQQFSSSTAAAASKPWAIGCCRKSGRASRARYLSPTRIGITSMPCPSLRRSTSRATSLKSSAPAKAIPPCAN
jgi:DNA-binding response OmpR family regulator